jgi:DNA-binding PadR family transcriptional regulator
VRRQALADTLALVIEMAILGVLKEHEAHGYEQKKRIPSSPAGPAVRPPRREA